MPGASKPGGLPRQRQLPLPWHFVRPIDEPIFAHPAEEELAKLLSFYRVRWLYEPTSFVLQWSEDGRPIQSFTPDFYLPEHHLYIEVTTMRQPLVTRKNRKLRLLRTLYPGVQIKLLYRRDVEQILGAYRDSRSDTYQLSPGTADTTEAEIKTRIDALSSEIADWSAVRDQPNPLLVIGVAPGALTFKRNLVASLRTRGVPLEFDRVLTTRYRMPGGRNHVRVVKAPRTSVEGRDILLVADRVNTGLSVRYVIDWLLRNGARRVEVCSLFTRSRSRLIDLNIRFQGFEAPDQPNGLRGIAQQSNNQAGSQGDEIKRAETGKELSV